jgi:hypothetical protein
LSVQALHRHGCLLIGVEKVVFEAEARAETSADPARVWELWLPAVRFRHDHLVTREGEVTVIRNRMYLLGPLARVWALLYGWRLRRAVRGYVARERELAEAA